jgi:ABC-type xylose transport system substrate-binding protein
LCSDHWNQQHASWVAEQELTNLIDFRNDIANIFENNLADIMPKPRILTVIFTSVESKTLVHSIEFAEKKGVKVIAIESLLSLLEAVKNDNLSLGFLESLIS